VTESDSNGRRRISVELPDSLVRRLDELKSEWGLRARGDCLSRLLEEIFNTDEESDPDHPANDSTELNPDELHHQSNAESASVASTTTQPSYNEECALVLIGRGSLELRDQPNDEVTAQKRPTGNNRPSSPGGIDLPGFVRKRTTQIRESLHPRPGVEPSGDAPLMPAANEQDLLASASSAGEHWLNLYGTPAGETVLEAAMTWLGRDIWPNAEVSEGRTFTWTQATEVINNMCPGWLEPTPRFEQVIVVAGLLEDPFATSELVHRIPTLIRRFVNRFKRSRKVTSFQTLESTMTVHGALKLLALPTQAGASLTLKVIREAYKKQAMDVHPDAGGSTEAMRRLNEAYQMLRELYRQKL